MTAAARKLRAVPPSPLFHARPEWAHPNNENHQERYLAAVSFLRRDLVSRWTLDHKATRTRPLARNQENATP